MYVKQWHENDLILIDNIVEQLLMIGFRFWTDIR